MKASLSIVAVSVLALALSVAPGCVGELSINDPNVEVSRLKLSVDDLGALVADRCVQLRGQQACARYPNPLACKQLMISIRGNGSTPATCVSDGSGSRELPMAQGLPIACRVNPDDGCVQCMDLYGGAVVDSCGNEEGLFTGNGFSSEDTGTLIPGGDEEQGGSEPAPPGPDQSPPGAGAGQCEPAAVQQGFVDKLNKILQSEGFQFNYQPDLSQPLQSGGFFGGAFFYGADKICSGDAPGVQDITSCDADAKAQGRCYCEEDSFMPVRCRCSRITAKVLEAACKAIPTECDSDKLSLSIWEIYGAATGWLNTFPTSWGVGANTIDSATGPGDIMCMGSPLVLDLSGDGVELTPVSEGVTFNLTGRPLRTAWVKGGDDALLALDRDGSGTIDHGGELFGEGTLLGGGSLASDGFQALAVLDRPSHGGNGNGLVEPQDLMYEQLLLWIDADRDGISTPGELRSLSEAGIGALQVTGTSSDRVLDRHGNDLSLRSRFLRSDGSSGLLVDALFVTRSP